MDLQHPSALHRQPHPLVSFIKFIIIIMKIPPQIVNVKMYMYIHAASNLSMSVALSFYCVDEFTLEMN